MLEIWNGVLITGLVTTHKAGHYLNQRLHLQGGEYIHIIHNHFSK